MGRRNVCWICGPGSRQVLTRSLALNWARRSGMRIASSLLRRSRAARIGVHPGDTTVPAIMVSIDRAVGQLGTTHSPARYADLATGEDLACAS